MAANAIPPPLLHLSCLLEISFFPFLLVQYVPFYMALWSTILTLFAYLMNFKTTIFTEVRNSGSSLKLIRSGRMTFWHKNRSSSAVHLATRSPQAAPLTSDDDTSGTTRGTAIDLAWFWVLKNVKTTTFIVSRNSASSMNIIMTGRRIFWHKVRSSSGVHSASRSGGEPPQYSNPLVPFCSQTILIDDALIDVRNIFLVVEH